MGENGEYGGGRQVTLPATPTMGFFTIFFLLGGVCLVAGLMAFTVIIWAYLAYRVGGIYLAAGLLSILLLVGAVGSAHDMGMAVVYLFILLLSAIPLYLVCLIERIIRRK